MELTGYLAVARRWWWTLLVATWVAAMAGLLVASRITPTYEAQVTMLVGPINTDIDTLKASGQLVQTYAQLAISTPLLKSTAQEVGGGVDPIKLGQSVRTTASDVTRVLVIRVQDSDKDRSAQIANKMADELIQLTTGTTTRPEGQLEVISAAVPPLTPIAPQVSLIVLLAMAAGLIGGLVLVIVVEYATDMVRDSSDLGRLSSTDVLATIAFDQRAPGVDALPVAAATAPGAANAIAFRLLASKVAFAEGDAPARSILVTAIGDGDSAVGATGIAAAVAASGHRVVLVDGSADGDITETLRLAGRPGLREALSLGDDDGRRSLVHGPAGVEVLARGIDGSVDLIAVDRARSVLKGLLAEHELVIIDGGAVQRSAGALSWARAVDQTIVLVRRGVSRRDDLRLAIESLRFVNATISGTVLVQRTPSRGVRSRRGTRAAHPTPRQAEGRAVPGGGAMSWDGSRTTDSAEPPAAAQPPVIISASVTRPAQLADPDPRSIAMRIGASEPARSVDRFSEDEPLAIYRTPTPAFAPASEPPVVEPPVVEPPVVEPPPATRPRAVVTPAVARTSVAPRSPAVDLAANGRPSNATPATTRSRSGSGRTSTPDGSAAAATPASASGPSRARRSAPPPAGAERPASAPAAPRTTRASAAGDGSGRTGRRASRPD